MSIIDKALPLVAVGGIAAATVIPGATKEPESAASLDETFVPLEEGETPSSEQNSFFDFVGSASRSTANATRDGLYMVGIDLVNTDESPVGLDTVAGVGLVTGANVGLASIAALQMRNETLRGGSPIPKGTTLSNIGTQTGLNGLRVTPTLVSAVAGPAVADGITRLAPNLVPKVKKEMNASEKQKATIIRGAVGAAAVGVAAGVVFLVKPDLFKKLGVNFMSDKVIQATGGSTRYIRGGTVGTIADAKTATSIAAKLQAVNGEPVNAASIRVLSTVDDQTKYVIGGREGTLPGMLDDALLTSLLKEEAHVVKHNAVGKSAAFSNGAMVAGAGAIGSVATLNAMAGASEEDKVKWLAATAGVVGVATLGTVGIVKATSHASINGGPASFLTKNNSFIKPTWQWIKEFGGKIAPITAVPAYMSASTYYDIVSDFSAITKPNTTFTRAPK
ncbi:MAG: hypothetical protein JWM90_1169 [Thermoleophilia bacterium]|nr:hypothetical protein [Thermoleophilia bacterium]